MARSPNTLSRLARHGMGTIGLISAVGLAACVEPPADGPTDPTAPLGPDSPRGVGDPAACDPGDKTLHRLNRREYDRTVRDLLGVDHTPALSTFPADDVAKGFDNNADVLSTSPLLTEKLVDSARVIADGLFTAAVEPRAQTVEAETLTGDNGRAVDDQYRLVSTGNLSASFTIADAGRYRITVRADQDAAGDAPARMQVTVAGEVLGTVDVTALADYQFEHTLGAGTVAVVVRFTNDFYNPDAGQDRNLRIDRFVVEGPLDVGEPGPGLERFVRCDVVDGADLRTCAEATLSPLLRRAFRRPVDAAEVTPYVDLVAAVVDEGDSFGEGLEAATEAMLLSPNFLFRIESDDVDESGIHRVTDHELATRLSYFLWGTMPDDTLDDLADRGVLSRRDVFADEVRRMLRSPKVKDGLATALSAQWLDTNGLDHAEPDPTLYPLSDEVRRAMKIETRLVVEELLRTDRPAVDLLDVDFTYVNAALAAHYGLPFPADDLADDTEDSIDDDSIDDDSAGFVKVTLLDTNRRGVLTHGAFLTGHSYPFRTSPVKRGRFVIDALLCIPPGDIPPDVPPLSEDAATGSVRERMEAHRSNPSCAACHAMMDPIGFGLESYDPVGRHRTEDAAGYAIDDSDVFFDVAFTGPAGMAGALKEQNILTGCMSERIGSYALGRGLDIIDTADFCTVSDVVDRATAGGFSFEDFVLALAETDAFQMRRAPRSTDTSEPSTASDDGV